MPPQAFLPPGAFTGFDANGGYSVANDASKLFGQALAEYEARLASPRNDIYGSTLKEDTAPALKAELLDPLLNHFGLNNFGRPGAALAPKTYHVAPGTEVVQVDPQTGQTTKVYSSAPKPTVAPKETAVKVVTGLDEFQRPNSFITATPSQLRQGMASGTIPQSQVATNQALQFYNNLTPPGAPSNFNTAVKQGAELAKSAITPSAFIGTPGVTPPIQLPSSGNPGGGTQTGTSGKKRLKFNPATGLIE